MLPFILMGVSLSSFAAIPKHGRDSYQGLDKTIDALHMTHDKGMKALVQQGHWAYRNLIKLAFDRQRPVQLRWRALTRMAKIGRKNSLPELERAARSDEWFLRAASLVSFRRVDHEKAISWARQLLKDPALVVRAEAVTTIKRMLDRGAKPLLFEQLYHQRNFRHGKSLWLRRKMAEAYALLSDRSDIANLVKVLEDSDSSLHAHAIDGLERITKNRIGRKDEDISIQSRQWQIWYAKNKDSLSL